MTLERTKNPNSNILVQPCIFKSAPELENPKATVESCRIKRGFKVTHHTGTSAAVPNFVHQIILNMVLESTECKLIEIIAKTKSDDLSTQFLCNCRMGFVQHFFLFRTACAPVKDSPVGSANEATVVKTGIIHYCR